MTRDPWFDVALEEVVTGRGAPPVRLLHDQRPARRWVAAAAVAAAAAAAAAILMLWPDRPSPAERRLSQALASARWADARFELRQWALSLPADERRNLQRELLRQQELSSAQATKWSRLTELRWDLFGMEPEAAMLDPRSETRFSVRLAARDPDADLEPSLRGEDAELWYWLWRAKTGRGALDELEAWLRTGAALPRQAELFFVASLISYRAGRYRAWPICWERSDPFIRELLTQDPEEALRVVRMMAWFYGFLNDPAPFALGAFEFQLREDLSRLGAPEDIEAEVDRLLRKMR